MHLKASPVEGFHQEFTGFELDTNKVELHSSDKRSIFLPYFGSLPATLQDNDGAYISINLAVGLRIGISLIVTADGKKLRYPVAATAQEINDILFPFFFEDVGSNKYHTRFGNGLDSYWLGNHQSSYTHWRRLVFEEVGMVDLIGQLSTKSLHQLVQYINGRGKTA